MFRTFAYVWFFISVSEAAMMSSVCHDVPTENETRSKSRSRSAVVSRRLVPLAGSALVPLATASRERSRELLEEEFDKGVCHLR